MAFTALIFMKFAVCHQMFVDIFRAKFYPEWMKNAPNGVPLESEEFPHA